MFFYGSVNVPAASTIPFALDCCSLQRHSTLWLLITLAPLYTAIATYSSTTLFTLGLLLTPAPPSSHGACFCLCHHSLLPGVASHSSITPFTLGLLLALSSLSPHWSCFSLQHHSFHTGAASHPSATPHFGCYLL
jgi:hypothetical protein